MTQSQPFAGLSPQDISVDEEGRVVVTNPQVAERLRQAAAAAPGEGAAAPINNGCTVNTVKNCGCRP
jgi:hypothetical protein